MYIPFQYFRQKSGGLESRPGAGRNSLISSVLTVLAILAVVATTSVQADSVNINAADSQTLAQAIDGVGDKLGEAIVKHRRLHGPFKNIDELVDVKGVGPKLVERNRDRLRLDNKPVKPVIRKTQ